MLAPGLVAKGDVVWINDQGVGPVRHPVYEVGVNARDPANFEFRIPLYSRWYGSDEEGVAWCRDEHAAVNSLRAAVALGAVPEDRPF